MSGWKIIYQDWIPDIQPLREALSTLGNGYFATRGAAEESKAGGIHYPGTYLAGGYNRLKSEIAGREIENEDLVNWPNWLHLTFKIEDGDWFDLEKVQIIEYHQDLDLEKGILNRHIEFRDQEGRESLLETRRLVSMADSHLAGIEWSFTPQNWSGKIRIHSALDGNVKNDGVPRYRQLNSQHLEPLETKTFGENGISIVVQTNQSHVQMAQASKVQAFSNGKSLPLQIEVSEQSGYIAQEISLNVKKQTPVQVEKLVSLYTSKDRAISEPALEACKAIERIQNFEQIYHRHCKAWSCLWHRCDMRITGHEQAQRILRLHIFHLLTTASMNTIDLDVGIPSRGWHGEAYRGHIFWDELFIFPFLNLRIPELTRALLMYRYRRLPEARYAAMEAGYKGAMYPWQSGSNGREESQVLHLNPKSGKWHPDNTYFQRHVNAAIVYNIWHYFQATNDYEFLSFYGAEMILDIARFWSSIATYNDERGRYEIHNVVGPDEYHTEYPDSDQPGLNNNAYTNVMAVWVLRTAIRVLDLVVMDCREQLLSELEIDEEEIARWKDIASKMYIPMHDEDIISQFEGYEKLPEFPWKEYEEKYENIQRLDRILKAEGDSPNRYKAGKQADVLMLFYLFSSEQLQEIFEGLGYEYDPEIIPKNIEYYTNRSSHGSSLSRLVYSWVLSRLDREKSWNFFMEALKSDVEDIQGGTTPEGIHLGAMSGTVDIIQRCYWGLEIRDNVLWLNPSFPEILTSIKQRIIYRGHWINLTLTHKTLTVYIEPDGVLEIKIGIRDEIQKFQPGETKKFELE